MYKPIINNFFVQLMTPERYMFTVTVGDEKQRLNLHLLGKRYGRTDYIYCGPSSPTPRERLPDVFPSTQVTLLTFILSLSLDVFDVTRPTRRRPRTLEDQPSGKSLSYNLTNNHPHQSSLENPSIRIDRYNYTRHYEVFIEKTVLPTFH